MLPKNMTIRRVPVPGDTVLVNFASFTNKKPQIAVCVSDENGRLGLQFGDMKRFLQKTDFDVLKQK